MNFFPRMPQDALNSLLQKHFGSSTSILEHIGEGLFSRAYRFINANKSYVLRVSDFLEDFEKDQWAYKHLGNLFPIPEILKVDTFVHQDKVHAFAISPFFPGSIMDVLPLEKRQTLRPFLGEMLLTLHQTKLTQVSGFGRLDARGQGTSPSWAAHLLNQENSKIAYNWEAIFGRDFFDEGLFRRLQGEVQKTLDGLPDYGFLVHGDFGFNNLLVQDQEISGVLDWAESKRGDFVFDWCWLDFWDEVVSYSKAFAQLYANVGMDLTHLERRRKTCLLHIGLSCLAMAGHQNRGGDYVYGVERLKSLGVF